MILSPRIRIVTGLVGLLSSLLVMALLLRLLPDPRETEREWRGRLCEAIGVSASIEISRNDVQKLQGMLTVLAQRHDDVLSAALRQADGQLVVEVGEHQGSWQPIDGELSTESQITIPLQNSTGNWGHLEVRFRPLKGNLWFEIQHSPPLRVLTFLTIGSFLVFYFYLGKVLEQLNPNRAVPGRVRSALDTLAEGLLVLDRKGRIVLCNQALATTLGQPPEKLTTKAAAKLPWIRDPKSTSNDYPWTRVLSGEPIVTQSTLQLLGPDGSLRIFVVNSSPVLSPTNEVRGVVCSFEDITVLESQKVELAHSKAAAEAANEAKSQFLANMSHEIRTPMNAILGFTEILRRGMYDNEEQRTEYLHTIHSSGQHLLRLINDILDLSKVEAGKLEVELLECSPHEILTDVVSILRVKATEKTLALTCETPSGLPETITTDAGRLRQILTNLIGNAIKFTERGGVSLVARLSADRSKLEVDVTDTGVGISAEAQRKIFDPFTQADGSITRRFGGTGLGLTISKKFAESLGGDVTVRSTPGQGSTFTVSVSIGPISSHARMLSIEEFVSNVKRSTTERSRQHLTFPAARILLADDGEANRQLIELVLRRHGLQVTAVTNGQEAIEAAQADSFDVIFMDMQMPVMDGYEATRRLRAQGNHRPIIALTANAMHGDEDKCRAAGCSGFLPKPVDLDKLVATLAELIADPECDTSAPEMPQLQRHETKQPILLSPSVSAIARSSIVMAEPLEPAKTDRTALPTAAEFTPNSEAVASDHAEVQDSETHRLNLVLNEVNLLLDETASAAQTQSRGHQSPSQSLPSRRAPVVSTLPLDDPEFREIVLGFTHKLKAEANQLSEFWHAHDIESVGRFAHWLKGAAGTMGFREFTAPTNRLMQLARDKNVPPMESTIAEILELVDATVVPA